MLRSLDIRDILIIDALELEFQPGLNVLTGETGAGKSILLDALGFVLGWRGRADLVRAGASQGEVTAVFDLAPDHPVRAVLREAGLPAEDELVVRRTNAPDGRKTARVNDRRVSGEVLRQLSAHLVELHGQHDDRGLLDPRGHRALLDAYGDHADLLHAVRKAHADFRRAERDLADATAALAAARADEDTLRVWVKELDAFAPEHGEADALDIQRRRMQGAERLLEEITATAAALGGEGAEGALGDALRRLDAIAGDLDALADPALAALDRAMVELGEAQAAVAACRDALTFDTGALDRTTERLFELRDLAKKHGVLPDDLPARADALRARLEQVESGAADLAALTETLTAAAAVRDAACAALSVARRDAAARLDAAVQAELEPLKMERAVFTTRIAPDAAGPEGADSVTFEVAPNPGAPGGPISRIASGGELSRFLLALKVCLTADAPNLTLIFDEIDRGVGGATADAVGRRLEGLAGSAGQVLVVTHSPQVAARGAHHWRVEKSVANGQTRSRVVALDAAARIDEVARMLSGDAITEAARAAARALLDVAR